MKKIDCFMDEYAFLSNYYARQICYNGILYENNEAAFQAQKCSNEVDKLSFRTLNPSEAKKKGRSVDMRKDWEQIKVQVMKDIVIAKFEQNPDLKEKLLATGDAYLEEGNTWGDRIWGTVDGKGANNLGRILMEVREKIR